MANNNRPVSGKNLKAGPPGTKDSAGVWQVNRTDVTLSNTVTVTDADGDDADLSFQVYTTDANGNPKDQVQLTDPETGNPASYGVVVSDFVASGGTAQVTLRYGDLKTNTTYAFRTSAFDGSLYETEWSAWAKFHTRGRQLSITLPEPDKNAPTVDLDSYQEYQTARRNMPEPSASSTTSAPDKPTGQCSDIGNDKIGCIAIGKPGDLTAEQQASVAKRMHATMAGDDLVSWCSNLSAGADYFKRTEACMKKATPIHSYTYSKLPSGETILVGEATFASEIQLKLDTSSTAVQTSTRCGRPWPPCSSTSVCRCHASRS
ncbi:MULTISPECIES: hypothetical protein [Streptomyces]|nr:MULTISPECIES: hypothetical protein [Streptomyces]